MKFRSFTWLSLQALLLSFGLYLMVTNAGAQTMSSNNYRLTSDSINFAGGLGTSSNYRLESTAGEIATGESVSASYALKAGYQQMQQVFLSITTPTNVVLTPDIGGITGGVANGSTSVTVLTDSGSGYSLTIKAATSPALQKAGDTIADYVPVVNPNPDFAFITNPNDVHFGFSPAGVDIVNRFKDNGIACNIGSGETTLACWAGLSTSETLIASGAANHPGGTVTELYFRVGVGGGVVVPAGAYFATTTLTALPL